MNETILVAAGANLPGPAGASPGETCAWAFGRLARTDGLRLLAQSRWHRSPAWPPSAQPDYVNGVARFAGSLAPRQILARLHAVEAEAGRVRGVANAARTLDLDLIAVDALILDAPDIVLPHPRLAQRAFVLAPLCDIMPGWRHPATGETAAALLRRLPDREATRPLP